MRPDEGVPSGQGRLQPLVQRLVVWIIEVRRSPDEVPGGHSEAPARLLNGLCHRPEASWIALQNPRAVLAERGERMEFLHRESGLLGQKAENAG